MESELAEVEVSGIPSTNPLLLRKTPIEYMLYVLRNIRSADLELSLLILPFHYVLRLIKILSLVCKRGTDIELVSKSCLFLFRAHQPRLLSTSSLSKEISLLSEKLRVNLSGSCKLVGTNMAALRYCIRHAEDEKSDKTAFYEDIVKGDLPRGGSKNKKRSSKNSVDTVSHSKGKKLKTK